MKTLLVVAVLAVSSLASADEALMAPNRAAQQQDAFIADGYVWTRSGGHWFRARYHAGEWSDVDDLAEQHLTRPSRFHTLRPRLNLRAPPKRLLARDPTPVPPGR